MPNLVLLAVGSLLLWLLLVPLLALYNDHYNCLGGLFDHFEGLALVLEAAAALAFPVFCWWRWKEEKR